MMRELKNYYAVLGITNMASLEEIKKVYRELVLKWHPDKNKSMEAETKMREINEAYDTLGDPEKKGRYDILFNQSLTPYRFIWYTSGTTTIVDGSGFTITVTY